jgi:hypothetical protein
MQIPRDGARMVLEPVRDLISYEAPVLWFEELMRLNRLAFAILLGVAAAGCTSTGNRGGFGSPGTPNYVDDQLDDAASPLPPDDRYGDDSLTPDVGGPE